MSQGAIFLHRFSVGNRDVDNPGINILSVPSTAAGDFDKANLTTESLRQVHRTTGVGGFQDYVIQAEEISQIDTFGILGHNLTSGAIVQINANVADEWTAPPVTKTVIWSKGNMVSIEDFGDSYEFYRLRILDPTNPCGYVQIGRIVGGRSFRMIEPEDITDNISITTKDHSDIVSTEGFFRVSTENVKAKTAKAQFNKLKTFPGDAGGEDENYLGLKDLFDHVGKTKPFLVVLDQENPTWQILWGQLDDIPSERYGVNRFASFPISITEVF